MNCARLILKQSSGWFAAGREFAQALAILSDGAFKLYVYACLRADRHTGRMSAQVIELAAALQKDGEAVEMHLKELQHRGICRVDSKGWLEITDRFWPYQKQNATLGPLQQTEFIRQVRDLFLAPACVQATFTPADEKMAAGLFRRGVTLDQVRRAILLGCARKYVTMLNNQLRMPITSLQYFAALLEEVADSTIPESYWEPLQRKVQQLEALALVP